MEKRDNKIFMQLHGSRYLAMQGNLLSTGATSVNGRIGSMLKSKNTKGLQRQKARVHIQMMSVDLHIMQFGEAQILCFSRLYTWGEQRADT